MSETKLDQLNINHGKIVSESTNPDAEKKTIRVSELFKTLVEEGKIVKREAIWRCASCGWEIGSGCEHIRV